MTEEVNAGDAGLSHQQTRPYLRQALYAAIARPGAVAYREDLLNTTQPS